MAIDLALGLTAEALNPPNVATFLRHISPDWVSEALEARGVATLRRRRLPAEQVVWLVIGMALFRDRATEEIVSKLDLVLPGGSGTLARSAIPQARARLGADVVGTLFERTAKEWTAESSSKLDFHGLMVLGVDGTVLRLPDTPENREHFGKSGTAQGIAEAAYPQMRVVVLMALRSHLLLNARFGPYRVDERVHAEELSAVAPDHSVTIFDRLFLSAPLLLGWAGRGTNRHWLVPAKSNTQYRVVEQLDEGDAIVEMTTNPARRKEDPTLPETWRARAITVKGPKGESRVLLTSLFDHRRYGPAELATLYTQRWEIELGYDEIKTHMLARQEALRSKTPSAIEQETWGILLAYNLVRVEIARIAATAKVDPVRISFVATLLLIRDEWTWCAIANPGAIPKHLARLRESIKRYVLPERRPRSYPRAVKVVLHSKYPRKRVLN